MPLIADFLPLLLFLWGYLYADLFFAVKVLMIAMPIGLALKTVATKKLDKVYLGSTIFLLIMGSATILFRNPLFLYWKPTVFYWALSIAFIASQFIGAKTIAERMFGKVGSLSRQQWNGLSVTWAIFFAVVGVVNIYVAYNFSEAFWVKFKVFGLTALTFVFAIGQAIWMTRAMRGQSANTDEVKTE